MKISTKGRYALRIMLDIAMHDDGKYIPLKDIAKRQNLTVKYLEQIISLLNTSEKVLNLLSDNQDAWNVEGNNIVFSNDNVRNQYDELINSIA